MPFFRGEVSGEPRDVRLTHSKLLTMLAWAQLSNPTRLVKNGFKEFTGALLAEVGE
jgi:hypothetical protein